MIEHIESDLPTADEPATPEPIMSIPTVELGVDPPPFGWNGNVKKLTGGEIGVIRKMVGTGMEDNPLVWMMYAAVAFARRYDREKYPWSLAERLTLEDVKTTKKQLGIEEEPDPT